MSNGDPLPPPSPNQPWWQDGRTIVLILGMLLGFGTQTITSCTQNNRLDNRVGAVQETQAVNAEKLEAVERKADSIKDKADKIGSKVGASGNGK